MNYQIISKNEKLIEKLNASCSLLDMEQSRHIQKVDLWLIDANTINQTSLTSYKNRQTYAKQLFFVNTMEEVALCIREGFTYLHAKHQKEELLHWLRHFKQDKTTTFLQINNIFAINFEENTLLKEKESISLTLQEIKLLKELTCKQFVSTKVLAIALGGKDETTIRTLINRIRKKVGDGLFVQKRGEGYKLNFEKIKEEKVLHVNEYVQNIEEQNHLMQQIVDSSPVFIVTFIHKKLYCINESFREYLGKEVIKELWDETKGDFWQLICEGEKEVLLKKGEHKASLYVKNKTQNFSVQTFYFEKLDKHLLVFTCK